MAGGEATGQDFLSREVQESKTETSRKSETLDILEQTAKICDRFGDPEKASQIRKDCEEVRLATINALKGVYNDTQGALAEIKGELSLEDLSEGEIDDTELNLIKNEFDDIKKFSTLTDNIEKSRDTKDTPIEELDKGEAHTLLTLSQGNYENFETQGRASKLKNKAFSFLESNSYNNIDNKKELHEFQEALIDKIYGPELRETGFKGSIIHGFGKERGGHFILTISQAEKEFKNYPVEKWNSLIFFNYLNKLDSQEDLKISTLLKKIGAKNILNLKEVWSKDTPEYSAKTKIAGNKKLSSLSQGIEKINFSQSIENENDFKNICEIIGELAIDDPVRSKLEKELISYIKENPSVAGEYWKKSSAQKDNPSFFEKVNFRIKVMEVNKQILELLNITYENFPEIASKITKLISEGNINDSTNAPSLFKEINKIIHQENQKNKKKAPLIGGKLEKTFHGYLKSLISSEEQNDNLSKVESLESNENKVDNEMSALRGKIEALKAQGGDKEEISKLSQRYTELRNRGRARSTVKTRSINQAEEGKISTEKEMDALKKSIDELIKEAQLENIFSSENNKKMELDFDNHETLEEFKNQRNMIKLISDKEDLQAFIEKVDGNIHLSEISDDLKGDFDIIRSIKNLSITDINSLPDSYFNLGDETYGSPYPRIFILLKNSFYSEKYILNKFSSNNDSSGNKKLADVIYQIITEPQDNLPEYEKTRLKKVFKINSISETLSQERKDVLGIQDTVSENDEDIKSKFHTIKSNLIKTGTLSETDKYNIENYLNNNSIQDIGHDDILFLIQNDKIPFDILNSVVPYIKSTPENNEKNIQLIIQGLQSRGTSFLSMVSSDFKSEPSVIQEALSGKTQQERKDILQGLPNKAIANAETIYAIYTSVGNDTTKVANLIWENFYENTKLHAVIDSKKEGKFHNVKGVIIDEIIRKIIDKHDNFNGTRKAFTEIQAELKKDKGKIKLIENYLDTVNEFKGKKYEQTQIINDLKSTGEVTPRTMKIIDKAFKSNKDEIKTFIDGLLNATKKELSKEALGLSQKEITITTNTESEELFEKNEKGEIIIGSGSKLEKKYLDFIQKEENKTLLDDEKRALFCDKYDIDPKSEDGKIIIKWLSTRKKLNTVQAQKERSKELAEIIASGDYSKLKEFNQKISEDYDTGKIFFPSTPPENEENPESIPSQSQQNLDQSKLDSDTQKAYNEISTELKLTSEEQNSLTKEELIAIASNQEVKESFVDFRNTLKELGLTELWKFRNDIFKAIGSLDFNASDGDYIGENELNIFLSKTVYATRGDKRLKSTPSNLDATKKIIREINHQSGGINDVNAVNTVGTALTKTEFRFIEQFAPRDEGIIGFKFSAFQKALNRKPEE